MEAGLRWILVIGIISVLGITNEVGLFVQQRFPFHDLVFKKKMKNENLIFLVLLYIIFIFYIIYNDNPVWIIS